MKKASLVVMFGIVLASFSPVFSFALDFNAECDSCSIVFGKKEDISKQNRMFFVPVYRINDSDAIVEGIKAESSGLYIIYAKNNKEKVLYEVSNKSLHKILFWDAMSKLNSRGEYYDSYYLYNEYKEDSILAVKQCIGRDLTQILYIFYLQ